MNEVKAAHRPEMEMEQSAAASRGHPSPAGAAHGPRLGAGWGWAGRWWWWWCAQTICLKRLRACAPASLLLAAWEEEVRTCPGLRIWAGLKTQAVLVVQTSLPWLTFNSHNAFPFSWAWLQRALGFLGMHI